MSSRRLVLLAAVLSITSCGGTAARDPLAPVPTSIRPDEIVTPPLRQAWSVTRRDDEGEPEMPSHAAAVGPGAIFIAYPDRLEAMDLNGDSLWEARLGEPLIYAPMAFRGGVAIASSAGWYWLNSEGAMTTRAPLAGTPLDAVDTPAGLVVVADSAVHLLTLDGQQQFAINWSTTVDGARRLAASPDGGELYVTCADGSLAALTTATGALRWHQSDLTLAPLRPAVGEAVYVIDDSGRLHARRRRDGNPVWSGKDIGIRVSGSPVAVGDLVWVPGLDAAVHAFTANGGSHQLRIPANGRIHLDLTTWDEWVVASPQYGPWLMVLGPRSRQGPADPGIPRIERLQSSDNINLPAASGPAGVVLIDQAGTVRMLTQEQGVTAVPGPATTESQEQQP